MNGTPMLGLGEGDRKRAGELLVELFDEYERTLATSHITPRIDREKLSSLLDTPFPEKGIGVEALFREINEKIIPYSTNLAHPRFLAYVTGPATGISPYADAIASTINQNCGIWQLSPAASVVERSVTSWLAGLFDLGPEAGGILTGGGSIANLEALICALNDRCPEYRRHGLQRFDAPLVLYTSEEAHRSVDKAAAELGIGLDHVRHIPTDSTYRLRVDLLREAIGIDRRAGLQPFAVVATAGTVTSGAIDPLDDIADVCHDEGLWLHVDGAYGALFVLSDRKKADFTALSRADSITLDPHKMLFASIEAGCLVVRDRQKMKDAHSFSSSYLTVEEDPVLTDYTDHGLQLTRGFKALKIWSGLQVFGTEAFRKTADQTLDIAQYFGQRVEGEPLLELMAPVTLTAICFRIKGATDAYHSSALSTLAQEGTALFGPASLDGRAGMRACVTNFRTTRADVDVIVDRLARLAADAQRG